MQMKKMTTLALAGVMLSGAAFAQEASLPKLSVNEELKAKLPEAIRTAGKMISVNNGSFPPYEIVTGTEMTGASADLTDALGEILGIKIEHETVGGLPALLTGINSGRYQFAFGPIGDFKSREEANDFVDWVQEFVVFAVQKGNPKAITSLDTACGNRIAVMAGGSAEKVIQVQAEKCKTDGKDPIEVQSFTDQPSSILAVRSKRSDAFFSSQAPLTYFVSQAKGQLELTGVGQKNGFEALYQGAVVPQGSPLSAVLRDAVKLLMDNGTYAAIMKKWGLENNMIKEPGVNLGGTLPK
ncbi:periplasmic component of amino acid ABC-type transporter/signal transduction system [Rhizobium leguminosarum bv. trifolii WSM2297]|uniref:Periplasmic component of amino acid ABC-type transporter/signal transduction system n=1 Tax=Rhizobium leguminosarum bv. trifolii WSM2297 TaxID=754762 RepID=J0CMQ9_RHILT|nr:ABC transporter substrate-binding protein [Rhizobium leguminosarum]EJC83260.1 periplasmic component of amino acid ABC-type transporter/signal transduction system [Rhizobium leguminosarum bv. trifolii WSM2297]EJC85147.1 periplasmic component of amino acid ABC-type transporter/signal transduction system [Rhizobium leguminosarum bv. trifolii WSM2297]